ncbi:hypothetical protein Mapa_015508 [Marchantia paleacea]|nr:hypothetical protein Mapa_015508 [Marchantia paleacea]
MQDVMIVHEREESKPKTNGRSMRETREQLKFPTFGFCKSSKISTWTGQTM